MKTLKKARLIKSIKEVKGGYVLSCEANKITIENVLKVLENGVCISRNVLKKFNKGHKNKIGNIMLRKNNFTCKSVI